jgi:hypothetical protein
MAACDTKIFGQRDAGSGGATPTPAFGRGATDDHSRFFVADRSAIGRASPLRKHRCHDKTAFGRGATDDHRGFIVRLCFDRLII